VKEKMMDFCLSKVLGAAATVLATGNFCFDANGSSACELVGKMPGNAKVHSLKLT